jgi:hypothetical protein
MLWGGSSTPVSIRTINTLNNTAYYVDNRWVAFGGRREAQAVQWGWGAG